MIGKLTGIIESIGEDWVILDVNGVGYEITCAPRTLQALPGAGARASLAIETHVRETEIRLFGFANATERAWFRLLQSVQGVGAKVALAIMGTLGVDELANAIALADKAMIARTPGVGPKVAGRIVSELEGKAPAAMAAITVDDAGAPAQIGAAGTNGAAAGAEMQAPVPNASAALADAVSALVNLGYGPGEARMAASAVLKAEGAETPPETLIRLALKALAK